MLAAEILYPGAHIKSFRRPYVTLRGIMGRSPFLQVSKFMIATIHKKAIPSIILMRR